jgi:hypothetical protein
MFFYNTLKLFKILFSVMLPFTSKNHIILIGFIAKLSDSVTLSLPALSLPKCRRALFISHGSIPRQACFDILTMTT